MGTGPKVSIVVPVYNGHSFLGRCIDELHLRLSRSSYDWELLIAEDGSTDGTKELCQNLQGKYPDVKFIQEDLRLGRGESLRRTLQTATGEILLYSDVDMSTDLRHVGQLIECINKGADIVTGSRYLPGSWAQRGLLRLFASLIYNGLVRLLLGSKLSDHQCGFKAFRRSAILKLLPKTKANHWFWDTEILIRAVHDGFRVVEVPVRWQETQHGKTTVRLASDTLQFLNEMWRLRGELRSHTN